MDRLDDRVRRRREASAWCWPLSADLCSRCVSSDFTPRRRGPFLPAQLRAVRVNVALNEPKVFEALNHRTGVIRTDVRDYWCVAFFQLRYEGGRDPLIPRCFGNARIDYR